jgi:DNA topoisomerase-1
LDQTSLRIGNKEYEQTNGTYGLTTLRSKHLKKEKNGIYFQFKAKGGILNKTQIKGKQLTRLILECSELPGYQVFQYLDASGETHPVFSQDVNSYLQSITEQDFTAKDFRTWGGTVWAVELYQHALDEVAEYPNRKLETAIVKHVAGKLGNTIAVCRSSYIHPLILETLAQGEMDIEKLRLTSSKKYQSLIPAISEWEALVLFLIKSGN